MAQTALHPLVRSYLKRGKRWNSTDATVVATSVLNRWQRFLDARSVDLLDATGDDCADYLAERCAAVKGSTAHKDYQHMIWLYRWLVSMDEIETRHVDGPMHKVAPPKNDAPDPDRLTYVSAEDYATLMASFDKRRTLDRRNAAICSLMYWSGLRRSEVCRTELHRLDLESDTPTIDVYGKNGRWRTVPIALETAVLLDAYLRRRGDEQSDALFLASLRSDAAGIRPAAITQMLKRKSEQLDTHFSSHEFRRSMAIEGMRRGLSETTICTVAGWTDTRMMQRYQTAQRTELALAEFHANDPSANTRAAYKRRTRRAA